VPSTPCIVSAASVITRIECASSLDACVGKSRNGRADGGFSRDAARRGRGQFLSDRTTAKANARGGEMDGSHRSDTRRPRRGEAENRRRKKMAEGTNGSRRGEQTARFLPGRRTGSTFFQRSSAVVGFQVSSPSRMVTVVCSASASRSSWRAWYQGPRMSFSCHDGAQRTRERRSGSRGAAHNDQDAHFAIWPAQERRGKEGSRQCGSHGRSGRRRKEA